VRIRTTTRPSASSHSISNTTAPNNSTRSDGEWAPSPGVLVYSDAGAAVPGRSADLTPAATTIPLAALRHANADEEVIA